MRRNACLHRLDLGLYSHPIEFWGMESEAMLTPRGNPLYQKTRGGSTSNAESCRTTSLTHYWQSYSPPPPHPPLHPPTHGTIKKISLVTHTSTIHVLTLSTTATDDTNLCPCFTQKRQKDGLPLAEVLHDSLHLCHSAVCNAFLEDGLCSLLILQNPSVLPYALSVSVII